MRKKKLCIFVVVILLTACTAQVFSPEDFKTISSENFVVYYPSGHERAAGDVLSVLEDSHDRVLNNQRPEKEGPFTVRLYPNQAEFHKAINWLDAPAWVVGMASGDSEFDLVSPQWSGVDYDTMLQIAVHEFTHCVTMTLIGGMDHRPMLWLVEGIALFEAGQFVDPKGLPYMQERDKFPRFLEMRERTAEMYDLGYIILDYIVETWGMESVRSLLLFQGNVSLLGMTDDEFYDGWYAFVRENYLD